MAKNKEKLFELIRYLIVGVLTTVVSLAIYYGLVYTILNPENATQLQIANIVSWIVSVIFAYITNRIFVFKSKNDNRLKEATSFVSSRVITLVMDMAIMFLGVSLLKQNDKIIKLISQIVIIVANYVFSKLFVFNNKKKNKEKKKLYGNILYGVILLIPIIDFIKSMLPTNMYVYWISNLIKGAILIYFIFTLIRKKQHFYPLFIILGFIGIEILYVYCKDYNIMKEVVFLLNIFFLPISLLYIGKEKNTKFDNQLITKFFFLYLICFLVIYLINPFQLEMNLDYFYRKTEIIGIIILLLPIAYKTLKDHHNVLAKVLGFSLLFLSFYLWNSTILYLSLLLTIIYFIWKDRKDLKKQIFILIPVIVFTLLGSFLLVKDYIGENITLENFDKVLWNERIRVLEDNNDIFTNANIEEQVFGLSSMDEIKLNMTKIDLADIYFGIGYFGIFIYFLVMIMVLIKMKVKSYYLYSILLTILMSFLSGHILTSASVGILIVLIGNASNLEKKKRILLVSNMYPSKKHKHYGSFVKNSYYQLESLDYQMDKVIMKKHNNKMIKVLNYIRFYIQATYKSIFNSYDFIYVHFISHSAFPVLLGKLTSKKTKLYLNAHGNDVVADYEWEEKNMKRSSIVIKQADKVIVPSLYFKEIMEKNYKVNTSIIEIYPSGGVNFDVFKKLDKEECLKELDLNFDYSYIGCVTRIEKDKGWDTLLKAMSELKKEPFMKKTKFIIIGSGREQEGFDKLVEKYKLSEFIIQKNFVYQSDLVKYYNAFDLFIFPTKRKSESLGLVGLEAMATNTFVIACDLYGPREYAIHGVTALSYKEEKDLASRIKEFKKIKETEKKKIIENAYKMAKKYDKEKLKNKLKEIFQEEES